MEAKDDGRTRTPGIRDVAEAAGVSVATASFAVNGRAGVANETRQRILAAAERLGYQANPQARALRRGRSNMYGLIVRNLANPFFLDVFSGAEEVASSVGATLVILDSQYSIERERQHVMTMAAQLVEGLAIAPVGTGESIRLWQSLRPATPAVALNASADSIERVSRIMPDNLAAVELPVRRLAELGHSRIAFLCAPRPLMADPDRLRHFRRITRALGVQGQVCFSALNMTAVQVAVERVLGGPRAPTAVIANSDYVAEAVYKAARRMGVEVGRELSVVGHDDLPTSELLAPPLATLAIDRRLLGREMILRLLGQTAESDFVAPVEYVERASVQRVGPVPVAPSEGCDARDAKLAEEDRTQLGNGP